MLSQSSRTVIPSERSRQHGNLQARLTGPRRGDQQHVGVRRARAERFLTVQVDRVRVDRVRLVRGSSGFSELPQNRPRRTVSEYQWSRCSGVPIRCGVISAQVVVGEQVRQRGIRGRDLADSAQQRRPGAAESAQAGWDAELEQTAGADELALVLRRAGGEVARGGVLAQQHGKPPRLDQRIRKRWSHAALSLTGRSGYESGRSRQPRGNDPGLRRAEGRPALGFGCQLVQSRVGTDSGSDQLTAGVADRGTASHA